MITSTNLCKCCKKPTNNPSYCSRSCCAKTTNLIPKRKKKPYFCLVCNKEVKCRRKYCRLCIPFFVDWSNITVKDVKAKRKYQKSSRIRQLARAIYRKSDKPKECIICKYRNHYEVCHIKAVSDFTIDTKISDINHIDNLIALCPTHHWELDNNYLKLK